MDKLHIGFIDGEKFLIPVDAVTSTLAVIGKRGSGKTYSAGVLEEEFAKNKIPFVVIDSMSAHWGIKSKFEVYIFGGSHADVPLSSEVGVEVADTIIETNMSAVLDVREFSRTEQRRFVADFCERLMARNESPRHIFFEESDQWIPQRVYEDAARCFNICDGVVRRGRQMGLGATLISQRAPVVNKDSLSQSDVYLFMRMISPQDVKAVKDTLEIIGLSKDELKQIIATLPKLGTGEALVYSPEWLNLLEHVKVRKRESFHAGRTPKLGELAEVRLVKVDASEIASKFADMIARKREEVSELAVTKKQLGAAEQRIEKLQHELEIAKTVKEYMKPFVERRGAPVQIPEEMAEKIERTAEYEAEISSLREQLAKSKVEAQQAKALAEKAQQLRDTLRDFISVEIKPTEPSVITSVAERLPEYERKIYDYLIKHRGVPFNRWQLAMGAGVSPKSSKFQTAIATLKKLDLAVEDKSGVRSK